MPLQNPDTRKISPQPLAAVICQVRFEECKEIAESSIGKRLPDFASTLGLTQMIQVHLQQMVVSQDLEPENPSQNPTQRIPVGWRLNSSDNLMALTLLTDQVTLETKKYADWNHFNDQWESVLKGLIDICEPKIVTRLGLRYLNRFELTDHRSLTELRSFGLVDKAFLGPLTSESISEFVTSNSGRLTLTLDDDIDCIINYAWEMDPQRNIPTFVLDTDCFAVRAREFNMKGVLDLSKKLNLRALQIFQTIIHQKLRPYSEEN